MGRVVEVDGYAPDGSLGYLRRRGCAANAKEAKFERESGRLGRERCCAKAINTLKLALFATTFDIGNPASAVNSSHIRSPRLCATLQRESSRQCYAISI